MRVPTSLGALAALAALAFPSSPALASFAFPSAPSPAPAALAFPPSPALASFAFPSAPSPAPAALAFPPSPALASFAFPSAPSPAPAALVIPPSPVAAPLPPSPSPAPSPAPLPASAGHTGPVAHADPTASAGPRAGAAADNREPSCGDRRAAAFPLRARITGGPAAYEPGAAPRTWYVELVNTTRQPCRNIHPVIVLTDTAGDLAPASVRMAFSTAPGGPPRTVRAEHTDHREIVGVLDDDADRAFTGFTVPPSGTVRVPVHLAFTADARPDEVTATAAVVQRRGDDGDWVGTSPPYRFTLAEAAPAPASAVATGPPPTASPGELAGTGRPAASHLLPVAATAAACLLLGALSLHLTRPRQHPRPGPPRR
ncbi:hypothetical protein [Streptomyces sudanensis]|uniref:hypothetical protein n=1 Tax=Streptomyces sudanensis TaxID=436397 RepID=UPI0020CE163A|nr:hypothetical protein [Streptomyces sudanensis]MCP9958866.1 hypothetical protein [Streptomyces sudanensis]MCQ0000657.1 hypothetical protein [Streptomyces sudanensis]